MTHYSNPTSSRWFLVFILWLAGIGAAMQFAKVSISFNTLQQFYHSDAEQIGWVLSIVGLFGLFAGASITLFIQRLGYKPILLLALLLGAILSFAESFLPSLPQLLILRFVEGISHLIIVVATPTLISACCKPNQRSLAMSLWGTFFCVTFSITHAFAPYWIKQYGISWLFLIHAACLLAITLTLLWLLPKNLIHAQPKTISLHSIMVLHQHIYGQLNTALPSLLFICYTSMFVTYLTLLPTISPAEPWVQIMLPLIAILGAFCAGFLVQYLLTPAQMIKLAFGGVLFALLTLYITHYFSLNLDVCKITLFFALGLQQGSIYTMIPHLTPEHNQQALSISAIAQLGNFGSTIGPPLFATAWSIFGLSGLIVVGIIITCIGLFLTFAGLKRLHSELFY